MFPTSYSSFSLQPLALQKPPNLGILVVWSSSDEHENSDDENEKTVGYDGLYEFLTRRTGEQAGESERQRKRDRIMDWMKSSKRSPSSSTPVRPIRLEDGKVDQELHDSTSPPRTKAKFDQLFAGMPTLEDILSKETFDAATDPAASLPAMEQDTPNPVRKSPTDESWFEPEKQQIIQEYEQIQHDMKQQIQRQRQQDPDGIPDNAEGIVESIVKQEMDRMLASVKMARAKERLQEYEISKKTDLDAKNFEGATDAVVEQILKEAAVDEERRQKLQEQADQFYQYEVQRQLSRVANADDTLQDDMDLDDWALERLEEMLETSLSREDDDGSISDILEDNIADLRKRIEKESKKGSIEPKTMKEWQMYRAIATRLAREQAKTSADGDAVLNEDDVDEAIVAQRLDSWREYIAMEDGMRKRSGLSSGPKLPFDYLGEKADRWQAREEQLATAAPVKTKTRRELRRDVNIQAIKAMEDLIQKTDNVRAEGLKKELEALKAELEPRDYNDIEVEVPEAPISQGPVDLSDVFIRDEEADTSPTIGLSEEEVQGVNRVLSSDGVDSLYGPPSWQSSASNIPVQQAPPNTPFFSESFEDEKKPPPPNTPFFQEGSGSSRRDIDIENKLGSVDEQKLQAMFRRAGARTKAEQDKIREEWKAFQQFEKQKRDASGLSESTGNDSTLADEAKLKYDISEVMKDGGDFDADKILSAIGPRPSRKSKSSSSPASFKKNEIVTEYGTYESDIAPSDVADSVFRSVLAAGGGIDNEQLQEKQRSEFEEYLKKESELRQNLDRLDVDAAIKAKSMDDPLDPDNADEFLSSIGPRPTFKQRRKELIDPRKLSDMGGVRSFIDLDDVSSEDDSTDDDKVEEESSAFDDLVPAWLKKEREAVAKTREESDIGISGSSIDEAFDDDAYEHNLRQLHEYEQRRSGRKQMGIDVSDIFGTRGSDDYADYMYDADYFRERQDGWGAASFQARKENLLQYIELDPAEINSVMAQKESVYTTGVSQYLPRINKPFGEFGAIFRLEGVLVDIRGLQQKVWKRVATEFDFKEPLSEDIQRAAVTRPEIVVREIFFGLNDIVLERKVLDTYRRILREEFNRWVEEQGIAIPEDSLKQETSVTERGSFAMGFEEAHVPVVRAPPVFISSEAEKLKFLKEKWTKTAKQFGYPAPTNEQIAESSIVTPDIAVQTIFGWASDQMQVDQIVSAYQIMLAGQEPPRDSSARSEYNGSDAPPKQIGSKTFSESEALELQYLAWKKIAEENSYETPDPEEVLAAAILNDPEAVVLDGFGWTEDPVQAGTLAHQFRERLAALLNGTSVSAPVVSASVATASALEESKSSGPTQEEILSSQVEAWKETAKIQGFDTPTIDRIQMVTNLSPQEAVPQLLLMDYDVDDLTLQEITQTYTEALKKSSHKYLQQYNISPKKESSVSGNSSADKSKDVSSDDIYRAAFDAWTNISWKRGFPPPDQEQVQFAMTVGPQDAIINGFEWTAKEEEAEAIAKEYLDQIKTKRDDWVKKGYVTTVKIETSIAETEELPLVQVIPGTVDWIKSLRKVEMGCGVVSHLEEDQMRILLSFAGLSDVLPHDVRVSHSSGYQRDSQQLLGAALRIERRPDHCVAFDTSPHASVAAHDNDMRSVSLVGPYPRYDLLSADMTATSCDELTAMNIRRLFGERVYDQPELDMKSRQPETNRRVKTKFDWGDDD
jgi:beta-phosphoglucomutase-like phosphatase (HAD superfamily)